MQALKKFKSALFRFWQQKKPQSPNLAEQLPDAVKEELAQLAMHLKKEHVSVRDLHAGEIALAVPEIGAEPFNENKAG